jgi:glycosyltransferase involved in cell wall biosynthesis
MDTPKPTGGPLISVVTPCLNRVSFVAEAVESVLRQGYPRFEHIVIDGGSTDGTLDELARYPHLRVICEPDRSLYDALNKGVRAARGDIIAHLNTDDLFPDGVLGQVGAAFAADPDLDVVYGGSVTFRSDPAGVRSALSIIVADPQLVSMSYAASGPICINAMFFHRRVYEAVGLYDWTYRIAGDREFYLRMLHTRSLRAKLLPQTLYFYRHHSGSLTFNEASFSEPFSREIVRMSATMLRTFARHSPAVPRLRRLHTMATVGLVGHAVKNRRWTTALRDGVKGCVTDPGWPIEFVAAGMRGLFHRLR